jgi:hypothetical protein
VMLRHTGRHCSCWRGSSRIGHVQRWQCGSGCCVVVGHIAFQSGCSCTVYTHVVLAKHLGVVTIMV